MKKKVLKSIVRKKNKRNHLCYTLLFKKKFQKLSNFYKGPNIHEHNMHTSNVRVQISKKKKKNLPWYSFIEIKKFLKNTFLFILDQNTLMLQNLLKSLQPYSNLKKKKKKFKNLKALNYNTNLLLKK